MSKHTPGPWSVEDPMGPDELTIVEANKETYEWRFLASIGVDGEGDVPRIEAEANARLIAASPALYEYVRSSADNGCATAIGLCAEVEGLP